MSLLLSGGVQRGQHGHRLAPCFTRRINNYACLLLVRPHFNRRFVVHQFIVKHSLEQSSPQISSLRYILTDESKRDEYEEALAVSLPRDYRIRWEDLMSVLFDCVSDQEKIPHHYRFQYLVY